MLFLNAELYVYLTLLGFLAYRLAACGVPRRLSLGHASWRRLYLNFHAYILHSDEREAAWVWQTQPDDGEPQSLYFDKGDTVRFRVEQEKWFDMATIPKPPRPQSEETSTLGPTGTAAPLDVAATAREIEEMVPYSLIVSRPLLLKSGAGCCSGPLVLTTTAGRSFTVSLRC